MPPQGNLLIKGLHVILKDKSLKIKTLATVKAREAAQKFMEWCLENPDFVDAFSMQLAESLQLFAIVQQNPLVTTKRSCGGNSIFCDLLRNLLNHGQTFCQQLLHQLKLLFTST